MRLATPCLANPFENASPLPSLVSIDSHEGPRAVMLQRVDSIDNAMDDAQVFAEGVDDFIKDQLNFACRLALAEEKLLTLAQTSKNSMSAGLGNSNLLGTVMEAKAATQAISAELGDSLVRLRDRKHPAGSKAGSI